MVMTMRAVGLLVAFTILALAERGAAIECYYCVSGQSGCDDPFDAHGSGVETVDQCDYCLKTKSETSGVQSIARTCATGSMPKDGCDKTSSGGVTTSSCYCDAQLCNGASTTVTSSFLVFGVMATLLFSISMN